MHTRIMGETAKGGHRDHNDKRQDTCHTGCITGHKPLSNFAANVDTPDVGVTNVQMCIHAWRVYAYASQCVRTN